MSGSPQMRRSTVIGSSGDSIQDSIRTSYGTFLVRRHDSVLASIEDRIAAWTQLPMTHQEDLQACSQTALLNCMMHDSYIPLVPNAFKRG